MLLLDLQRCTQHAIWHYEMFKRLYSRSINKFLIRSALNHILKWAFSCIMVTQLHRFKSCLIILCTFFNVLGSGEHENMSSTFPRDPVNIENVSCNVLTGMLTPISPLTSRVSCVNNSQHRHLTPVLTRGTRLKFQEVRTVNLKTSCLNEYKRQKSRKEKLNGMTLKQNQKHGFWGRGLVMQPVLVGICIIWLLQSDGGICTKILWSLIGPHGFWYQQQKIWKVFSAFSLSIFFYVDKPVPVLNAWLYSSLFFCICI